MKIQNVLPLGLVMAVGLFAASLTPAQAFFGVSVNVGIAPPPLPVYAQPICPGDGYIWTPGYWAWDASYDDYYWVPGTWVLAPEVGFLWTPPWWGWSDGAYCFHDGYWGPHVGFYGGVAYGYGYFGRGYDGGRWNDGHFYYNRTVNNVTNVNNTYLYSKSVEARTNTVSYNGGRGGVTAQPTAAELQAGRESHVAATGAQTAHIRAASTDPSFRYANNHGRPAVAATSRAGEIHNATNGTATSLAHRTTTGGAVTGESHRTAESTFTGETHAAVNEHPASTATEAKKSFATTENHHATTEAKTVTHAPVYHPATHVQAFHAATHAPTYHAHAAAPRAASRPQAAHASAAHASASHKP
jgi:hypothetical protein